MYQTSEGGDWIFSNMVYFEIIKNGLLIPYISTEKSEYVVGDEINISWSPSPADSQLSHYWLVITSPDGKEIVGETMNLNTSFSFTVEQIGNYTIKTFATPFNSKEGEGSLTDTKTISVIAISTTSKTTTTTTSTTTTTTTTEPAYLLGDVNEDGSVDSSDASLVLAEYAKIQTGGAGEFTDIQYKAADVNKDDTVDSSDASRILAYYAAISTGRKPTWD